MITALVGGSFGSEGKGLIAGHLAGNHQVHVRVGAANAGHTVWVRGEKHVVQQLPCAAYANPWAKIVLGAGALISPDVLRQEVYDNQTWRRANQLPALPLYIDVRAHAVVDAHIEAEQQTDLQERIGSTSATAREGIGTAQAARVLRTDYALAIDQQIGGVGRTAVWCDTIKLLHDARTFGTNILLEGTQGTGLSNTTGYLYPYVTSRDVIAGALAAQCGLGPRHLDRVILVCRTFPIRVAGNSGPFYADSEEISWDNIAVDENKERTTVTKKVRRVATFSMQQVREAAKQNSATDIALTFADYLNREIVGLSGAIPAVGLDTYDHIGPLVRKIETETGVPVTYIGTGPATVLERESGA